MGKEFRNLKTDKEYFKKRLKNNLYKIGLKNLKILYCLNLLDKKIIAKNEIIFFDTLKKTSIPEFPFDGKFLIKKGIQEGKNIGIILKEAEKIWAQNNFNLSTEDFELIIKKNII